MKYNRLADIEDILGQWYRKLAFFEKAMTKSSHIGMQYELNQEISEILINIRKYEAEYWDLCPKEEIFIDEKDAETQIIQVKKAIKSIRCVSPYEYPIELTPLLKDIESKLDNSGESASEKLKLVLPLIPTIASYELEINTDRLMYKTWKVVKRIIGR